MIPDTRKEVAMSFVRTIQSPSTASVSTLAGQDSGDLLLTTSYGDNAPFVHHTSLGWAMVGSVTGNNGILRRAVIKTGASDDHEHFGAVRCFVSQVKDVFARRADHEMLALSPDAQRFWS